MYKTAVSFSRMIRWALPNALILHQPGLSLAFIYIYIHLNHRSARGGLRSLHKLRSFGALLTSMSQHMVCRLCGSFRETPSWRQGRGMANPRALGLQNAPSTSSEGMTGPSEPTPNTFSEGTTGTLGQMPFPDRCMFGPKDYYH